MNTPVQAREGAAVVKQNPYSVRMEFLYHSTNVTQLNQLEAQLGPATLLTGVVENEGNDAATDRGEGTL